MPPDRLAIVCTHPIQYYSPWFDHLSSHSQLDVRVFYLWEFGIQESRDPQFGRAFKWDVPLLDGHPHEFVPNVSRDPGTHHFGGIDNPGLAERVDAFGPSAVLCMGYNYKSILRLLVRPRRKRPFMIFRGDSTLLARHQGPAMMAKSFLRRVLFRRFDHFLHVGQKNREYLVASGATDVALSFSPHAVNNGWFFGEEAKLALGGCSIRGELRVPDTHAVLLFAGKFSQVKRPELLLSAFLKLDPAQASLIYCGDGAMAAALHEQAGNDSRVHFLGFRNQSEMPAVYHSADLLVLPSQGETWGLCVNEAFCMGTPALVSDHVGCHPDLIKRGVTGEVFRAGDADDLAVKMSALLADRAALRTMGDNARELISHYSYEQATAGLLEALEKLRARRKSARA